MTTNKPNPPTPLPAHLIPVKVLRLETGKTIDLPGKHSVSSASTKETTMNAYDCVFLDLRLRAFRIEAYGPGNSLERQPQKVLYVHESWGVWEPM